MENLHRSLAEDLRRAHAELRKDLRELEAAARTPAGAGGEELRACLGLTGAHLTEHFRLEEQNGYMDAVLQRDPNRERAVRHLQDEHRRLAASLDALLEAAAGRGPPEALRAGVLSWVERVRDHEARENALVQDTFNVDLSAED